MAETREIFEQVEDEQGRTRLDRPFTPEEAKEQDERNRAKLGYRTGRFDAFMTGTEKEPRAKLGRTRR